MGQFPPNRQQRARSKSGSPLLPFRRRINLWAISEQLSQFQQTIQSVAGIIAFGPPVNHPLFCAAVTTQVRIPSRPLVLSKSVSSSKSRRGDQSENEASHMYKVSHSTQCGAHILLVDRI